MKARWLTCGRLLPCGHGAGPRFASTPQRRDDGGLISLPLERRHLQAQQRCKIFLPSVEAMMKSPVFSPRVPPPPSLRVTYCRHALWATQLRRVRFSRTARPDSLAGGLSHYLFRTVEFAVSSRCFAHFPPRPRAVLHLMPAGCKFTVSWE